jgi:HPt (histidine-containing phosphotransfer) domain-containing protein
VTEDPSLAPVLDAARFAELDADFGPDGAREIVAAFLVETDRQLASIDDAVAGGATGDGVAREAHGVKGGAMLVGASRLQEAAMDLERTARAGADARGAAAALRAAWEATRPRLAPVG